MIRRVVLIMVALVLLSGSFVAGYVIRDRTVAHCHTEHDAGSPDASSVYCNRPLPFRSYSHKKGI